MITDRTMPSTMTPEERNTVVTAAFCAYIMHAEHIPQDEAIRKMARLCTITQGAIFRFNTKEGA